MIPPLDSRGLLPAGLHFTELEQIPLAFCGNEHRWRLWDDALAGLDVLCPIVQAHPAHRPVLVLAGSFFSDKALPADIEATLVFPPDSPAELCWFWAVQSSAVHAKLKTDYRLDFYPSLPGQNDFSRFFQYVGPKTAAAKGLNPTDPRGALRLLQW